MMGFGIGRTRQSRDRIELLQQATHDMIAVAPLTDVIQFRHGRPQRRFDAGDGLVGEVLPLILQTPLVFEKFLSIEIATGGRKRRGGRPGLGQQPQTACGSARHIVCVANVPA